MVVFPVHTNPTFLLIVLVLWGHFEVLESSLKGPTLPNACRFSQFRCHDGTHCLETEKLCNGVHDCPLGEDETGNEQYDCTRSTLSDDCLPGQFRCRFGGCIGNELRCNGIPDCWGGTDEAIDFCNIDPSKWRKRVKKPTTHMPSPPVKTTVVHVCTHDTVTPHSHASPPPPTHPVPAISINFPDNSSPTPATPVRHKQVPSSSPPASSGQHAPVTPVQAPNQDVTFDVRILDDIPPVNAPRVEHLGQPPSPRVTHPPPSTEATTVTVPLPATSTRLTVNSGSATCPPVELELGQRVFCFHQRLAQEIQCEEHVSPEGTRAEISCKQFWTPPETGPNRSFKVCKGGEWTGGSSEFACELDCGTGGTAPTPYVTGGQPSEQGKWPWHAGLYENNPPGSSSFQQICGATLITRQAVLTAAHCVTFPSTNQKRNEASLRVYLGKFFRPADQNNEFVQPIGVNKIVVHRKYNYAQLENDIALLRLNQPVDITAFVHPVCMPFEDADGPYVGDEGVLAGWGSVGDREYPDELREAKLPVRSNRECIKNSPVLANLIRESTFCAGHKNGTAACDGDSGGGLVFRDEFSTNKFKIYGVVSGGVPRAGGRGCDPNYFVAFTRVSSYRKWIDRVLDSFSHLTF